MIWSEVIVKFSLRVNTMPPAQRRIIKPCPIIQPIQLISHILFVIVAVGVAGGDKARITSYNVCYTKLLRLLRQRIHRQPDILIICVEKWWAFYHSPSFDYCLLIIADIKLFELASPNLIHYFNWYSVYIASNTLPPHSISYLSGIYSLLLKTI